jgi:hypothetical protein
VPKDVHQRRCKALLEVLETLLQLLHLVLLLVVLKDPTLLVVKKPFSQLKSVQMLDERLLINPQII